MRGSGDRPPLDPDRLDPGPWLSICLGLTLPNRATDERTTEIVSSLLHNIYRAFDFRGEENIYDVLDQSVSGDLLTDIYLETRRGLELASQGGARAKVKEIEMLEVAERAAWWRSRFCSSLDLERCRVRSATGATFTRAPTSM